MTAEQLSPPSGTLTFLFTDVVGSTRLWDEHPRAMQLALERHDEILRSVVAAHGGYVFSTAGDAFAVAFARAGGALDAAVEAQRIMETESWPDPVHIWVRMGLHTGEAQERGGDYFGTALNRAARVMGLGAGGQILMSAATAELVEVDRRSEGVCELRGLAERVEVFSVLATGLSSEFPALRTAAALGNLPSASVDLVGREGLIGDLVSDLAGVRLVTLVGPGGIGKTSLAVALGRRVEELFPAGVWLVELAPVRDPDALVAALGSAIGARAGGGKSLLDAALALLSSEPALVIVDNCEHLVAAAADLVHEMLSRSSATVLATGRSPLHLRDEMVRHVPPLAVDNAAVRLFGERARQVRDDFVLDDSSTASVAQICRLVDGMPLAVELAAARCRSMSPADVLARLERDAGKVLRDSRRDGQERQRTMRATVEWSYELLSDEEQELFARLSVFAGSFDLGAAEAVCSGGSVDEFDVADLLDGLVDQSLLSLASETSISSRYRMLEPIRQFADQLLTDGSTLNERHASHYAALAEESYDAMWSEAEAEWIQRLEADFPNHRVAYQYWADRGRLTEALTIAISLNQLGELALQRPDGAEVLFDAVDLKGIESHELGPIAIAHVATALGRRRDPTATDQARRALELAATPRARYEAALWAIATGFFADDEELFERGVHAQQDALPQAPQPWAQANAAGGPLMLSMRKGDHDLVEQLVAGISTTATSSLAQAMTIGGPILYATATGNPQLAVDLALRTVDLANRASNRWAAAAAISFASSAATQVLPPRDLLRFVGEFLPAWRQANDLSRIQWSMIPCASAFIRLEEHQFAATLIGGSRSMTALEQSMRDQLVDELRQQLGTEELDQLLEQGAALPPRDLGQQLLQYIDSHT